MKIYGLDFTSAPTPKKPITLAECTLDENILEVRGNKALTDFSSFEAFLAAEDDWVAGIDFPFGLPRKLVTNLGWPELWEGYVQKISEMKKAEFGEVLRNYREPREKGDKQHKRRTDDLAGSCSPMMWYGVPVGKMLYEGAPRLFRSKSCVLPFRGPKAGRGVIVEAYPALVARKIIRSRPYKSDDKRKQTEDRRAAREKIIQNLNSASLRDLYGFRVRMTAQSMEGLSQEGSADTLDALLCAVQAAWAYTMRHENFGIPPACDRLEGWIADPEMLSATTLGTVR